MTIAITPEKVLVAILIVGVALPVVFGGCGPGPSPYPPDPYDPEPYDGDIDKLAHDAIVAYAREKADLSAAAASRIDRGQFETRDDLHEWLEEQNIEALETAYVDLDKARKAAIDEDFDQKEAARVLREEERGYRRVR